MSNVLMSQESSPMFDLLSQAYGGGKAGPRSPTMLPSPRSPRPSGCQFLELRHYKDSRTGSHMRTALFQWVQACKQQNQPTARVQIQEPGSRSLSKKDEEKTSPRAAVFSTSFASTVTLTDETTSWIPEPPQTQTEPLNNQNLLKHPWYP